MEPGAKLTPGRVRGKGSAPDRTPAYQSTTRPQKGKKTSRVKSGCGTCKARKVKCDEERPICKRCIGSGRICQGYGIWGGGNAWYATKSPASSSSIKLLLPRTAVGASSKELELLDWFRYHSTTNLHCAFGSKFWEDLTLRASLEEPAVFHSVLALSAIHKRFIFGMGGLEQMGPEDALLTTYLFQRGKAVQSLLRPYPANAMSKSAVRTALIACMILTSIDFTLGQYESGTRHFHSGIKLLSNLRPDLPVNPASPGSYIDNGNSDADDRWIIEAFGHGNLNTSQFGIGYWIPEPVPKTFCMPLPVLFETMQQAKQTLDSLLSDTFKITAHARSGMVFTNLDEYSSAQTLVKLRQSVQSNLKSWLEILERSTPSFRSQQSQLGLSILHMFYAMTTIMADVSLTPDDAMVYDSHTHNFHTIIACGQGVLRSVNAIAQGKRPGEVKNKRELYAFVPDGGWQSPLFFTALNCRIRRLRLHAVKYLDNIPAQEFIWNHKIAADIGRVIIDIEHGLEADPDEDDFNILDVPPLDQLTSSTLPVDSRISNAHIALYDAPARAVLTYSKQSPKDGCRPRMREYGISQCHEITHS